MERIGITIKEEFILFLFRNKCLESYFKHLLSDKNSEIINILDSECEENWIRKVFESLGHLPTFWGNLHEKWGNYLFNNGSR